MKMMISSKPTDGLVRAVIRLWGLTKALFSICDLSSVSGKKMNPNTDPNNARLAENQ